MRSLRLPELVLNIPIAIFAVSFSGAVCFSIWKIYQLLTKINDNLTRIRQAIETASLLRL